MKTLKIVEKSKIWFVISIILIVISIGSLAVRGLNFGIDFQGGTIITINLHTEFNTDDVRAITDSYDEAAEITYSGDSRENVVISTKESLDQNQRQEIFNQFKEKYSLEDSDLISANQVSGTISSETTRNAVLASAVAIVLMLIYITFRFEFLFGVSAIIALLHDIIVVIGVYALFQIQVNSPFIAAILTILGYSINDTIVVFDRIRENEGKMGTRDINNLVNSSITQTMKRSLFTVITTLLAVLALFILGPDSIKEFTLPLIVGIACGCYSSIFVASPLWVLFQNKTGGLHKKGSQKRNKKTATKNRNREPQL